MSLIYINDTNSYTNVILIDTYIKDYNILYSSCNSNTFPIAYNSSSTQLELLTVLRNKFTTISRLSLAFEYISKNYTFLDNTLLFLDNENSSSYSSNVQFIMNIINEFNISNIDYLACNSLQYSSWITYYNILSTNTSAIVGASDNETGNIKYGGDWVLESSNENIRDIYFTNSINNYAYLLKSSTDRWLLVDLGGTYNMVGWNRLGVFGIGEGDNIYHNVTPCFNTSGIDITPNNVKEIYIGVTNLIILKNDDTFYATGDNNYYINNNYGNLTEVTLINNFKDESMNLELFKKNNNNNPFIKIGEFNIVTIYNNILYGIGDNDHNQLNHLEEITLEWPLINESNIIDMEILDESLSINCDDIEDIFVLPRILIVKVKSTPSYKYYIKGITGEYNGLGDPGGNTQDGWVEITDFMRLDTPESSVNLTRIIEYNNGILALDNDSNYIYILGNNNNRRLSGSDNHEYFKFTSIYNTNIENSNNTIINVFVSENESAIFLHNNTENSKEIWVIGRNQHGSFGIGTVESNYDEYTNIVDDIMLLDNNGDVLTLSDYTVIDYIMERAEVYLTMKKISNGKIILFNAGWIINGNIGESHYKFKQIHSGSYNSIKLFCLKSDTEILTPSGYKFIHTLKKGDKVITDDNRIVKIKQIYSSTHYYEENLLYVIKKDTIRKDIPNKDLYLSKYHFVKINGKMFLPMENNNDLIIKYPILEKIKLYNIMLDNYETDWLIANGLVVESFAGPRNPLWEERCVKAGCKKVRYSLINKKK